MKCFFLLVERNDTKCRKSRGREFCNFHHKAPLSFGAFAIKSLHMRDFPHISQESFSYDGFIQKVHKFDGQADDENCGQNGFLPLFCVVFIGVGINCVCDQYNESMVKHCKSTFSKDFHTLFKGGSLLSPLNFQVFFQSLTSESSLFWWFYVKHYTSTKQWWQLPEASIQQTTIKVDVVRRKCHTDSIHQSIKWFYHPSSGKREES